QVYEAVVVQIAELGAPAPASLGNSQAVGQVHVTQFVAGPVPLRHPQVIPLQQHSRLGDVGDIDGEVSLIVNVAETDAHAALGLISPPFFLADLDKLFAFLIGIDLIDPVVVGQPQVRVAGAAQIGGGHRQCPALAGDAHLLSNVGEAEPVAAFI